MIERAVYHMRGVILGNQVLKNMDSGIRWTSFARRMKKRSTDNNITLNPLDPEKSGHMITQIKVTSILLWFHRFRNVLSTAHQAQQLGLDCQVSFWCSFQSLPTPAWSQCSTSTKLHHLPSYLLCFFCWKDTGSPLLGCTQLDPSVCHTVSDRSDFQAISGVILSFRCLVNAWFAFISGLENRP